MNKISELANAKYLESGLAKVRKVIDDMPAEKINIQIWLLILQQLKTLCFIMLGVKIDDKLNFERFIEFTELFKNDHHYYCVLWIH